LQTRGSSTWFASRQWINTNVIKKQILDNIVTVEINNQTIRERGQWPWDRETLGKEIIKLYQAGAGLVVVPILFADPDRGGKDKFFADILKQTPTIIGQIPTNDNSAFWCSAWRCNCRCRLETLGI
jgi:CHASE2 domain-containing sensor protein